MQKWLIAIALVVPCAWDVCLAREPSTGGGEASGRVSLAGPWRVAVDGLNAGLARKWWEGDLPSLAHAKGSYRAQPLWMKVPGSTDESQLGIKRIPGDELTAGLERVYEYDGPVWLQRKVNVPEAWRGKKLQLFLERTQRYSRAWWNDLDLGEINLYATPHVYTLSRSAEPGEYRLTVLVDNTRTAGQRGHHFLPGSGATWNGIIGRVELLAKDQVSIHDIQVYPDIQGKKARVKITLDNLTSAADTGTLNLSIERKGLRGAPRTTLAVDCSVPAADSAIIEAEAAIPEPVVLWDEFNPCLYELKVQLRTSHHAQDAAEASFGMREFRVVNGQFNLNGRPILLRGTHEGIQFPLTAYPPMDVESWRRVFKTCKAYGLNHLRCHTWCPPEAAFQAADELGFLIQVEMAERTIEYTELPPIIDTYGNHPSFGMVSLSNEVFSHDERSRKWIRLGQQHDPRHLYCCNSHPWKPGCCDDYYVSAWGVDQKRTVGIEWGGGDVLTTTRFNTAAPETASDYRDAIKGINGPLVSHEVGQWAVYPNLAELPKYNGLLRNYNYERIQKDLTSKGMLGQAAAFTQASGQLSLLLYKEEIESALRTPGFGGFQLLDLHDYPGQDVSTVGILDSFWDSKGLITPEKFRQFCSPEVPLLRMSKRVWTQSELFKAEADLAYYGRETLHGVQPVWRIEDEQGKPLLQGTLATQDLALGGLRPLGTVETSLQQLRAPAKLAVVLEVPGIQAKNQWDIWLYPDKVETAASGRVRVLDGWSEAALQALKAGESLLVFPKPDQMPYSRPGCFTTIFWGPIGKSGQAAQTMGILCDPAHPAFKDFPTDFHSNWQWWDLVMHARAMMLDDTPRQLQPVIQVIDAFSRNQKLGYLFECRVGQGKLVVCAIDLETNLESRPVARQFRHSLLEYMNSASFQPRVDMDPVTLKGLFHPTSGADRHGWY